MKKYVLSIMLFIATLGVVAGTAVAAPIVSDGSTYSIYLQGNGDAFLGVTVFDSQAASAQSNGIMLTLSESETTLGGGLSRIVINLSADEILFPSAEETGLLAIGVDGNGLDLTTQVALEKAFIIFRNSANEVVSISGDLAGEVPQNFPWDGFFPAAGSAFANDVGGLGVTSISFDFLVRDIQNQVPEPATALLAGIGLIGMFSMRRKAVSS